MPDRGRRSIPSPSVFIMPSWMIHVWYGLGILVALILGLWLGRRMAYQNY